MTATPRVSILLVTRDGMSTLPAVLDAIARQRTSFDFELVAIDSGSSDGSRELLSSRVDRLVEVRPRDFDHGETRNLGVEACRGELVALLVQDAEPADEHWLEELTAPFDDPRVAGSYARQLLRPDAGALTRHYLREWPAVADEPHVREIESREAFASWRPMERYLACVFDDVSSCIRRSAWREHRFPPSPIAEDVAWAKRVLLAGWRIAYAPRARVVHSHERGVRHEFARTRVAHRRLAALFDLRTIPSFPQLARAIGASLWLHLRCVAGGPRGPHSRAADLARAVGLAFAYPLGQYLGARNARYEG
jgi:GT2 family glycosyltransferase